MYTGPRVSSAEDKIQFMFFDSEGINGTKKSVTTKNLSASLLDRTYYSSFGYPKNYLEEEELVYLNARLNHVQNSYPKLLYLFGDVVLFVTTHNWRETTLIDSVLTWARAAGGNALNKGVKPKLLIIFNKVRRSVRLLLYI